MANNMENRDAYIIIGIDEEKEYYVNDMSSAENRKNTQMLVNFLRDKKFAGGIRPRVMVDTMQLEVGVIDIIVIKNGYSSEYSKTINSDKSLQVISYGFLIILEPGVICKGLLNINSLFSIISFGL